MKTLYYTVATPDKAAISCSRMLHRSIRSSVGPVNFKIVVPDHTVDKYPNSIKEFILPAYKPNKSWSYIGDMKYTPSVYELDYDNFVYVDSDILWFVDDFDPSVSQFTFENKTLSNAWFSTGWEPKDPNRKGVCAGFFCITKEIGLRLSKFVSDKISSWSMADCPKMEQSSFNHFLELDGYDKWKDVSNLIVAAAKENTKFSRGKMFHFQGWQGSMDVKYDRMSKFIKINKLKSLAE